MDSRTSMMLDHVMAKNGSRQMTRDEYAYVSSFLGHVRFLVFGCGHDSNFWRYVNKGGVTCFLEDHDDWAKGENVFKVDYGTKAKDFVTLMDRYKSGDSSVLEMDLPYMAVSSEWDCILVDAPKGGAAEAPGRMKSIYAASRLASSVTHVFVHDCNRAIEMLYSNVFLGRLANKLQKMNHYVGVSGV